MKRGGRDTLRYYPLLPFGALIAIVWANTAGDSYFRVAQTLAFPVNEIGATFGLASLAQEVLEAIGPGRAMTSWRSAVLPVALAIGGTLGAAAAYAIYLHFTDEQILASGWRIACGVDIFFCVALARLIFRHRIPVSVVVLFAVVCDAIALLLISRQPFMDSADAGAISLIVLAVVISVLLRTFGVRSMWPYLLVAGPVAWCGCYWSGIHPRWRCFRSSPSFHARRGCSTIFVARPTKTGRLTHFESVVAYPLQAVAFLFGLANAGVLLQGVDTGTWAVLTASLVGRPIGILFAAAAVPRHSVRWSELIVIALIGSVGLVFGYFCRRASFLTARCSPKASLARWRRWRAARLPSPRRESSEWGGSHDLYPTQTGAELAWRAH